MSASALSGLAAEAGGAPAASAPDRDKLTMLPAAPRADPTLIRARVLRNEHVADRYWRIALEAPSIAATVTPGQFVMLTVTRNPGHGPVLPRPMAVYDADPSTGQIEVLYSVVGDGTGALSSFSAGERVVTVGPLGRGFDLPSRGGLVLLGRGIGTCSLTLLAARATAAGRSVIAVASGRHPLAVIGANFYGAVGAHVLSVHDLDESSAPERIEAQLLSLVDGDQPVLVAASGSRRLELLAARLGRRWQADVQVAVEAHMACGLGYCHGCSNGTRTAEAEAPLVCRDGPVFSLSSQEGSGRRA